MTLRRSHYESAFEAYLNHRGIPFVAVEDVRHFVKGRLGAKAFDYIVYPPDARPWLVDVKGRKIAATEDQADARTNNWVTRSDLTGLGTWKEIFGPEFDAAFVFAFWLAGESKTAGGRTREREGVASFAGRQYSFWLTPLAAYQRWHKQRSQKWDTVTIPTAQFRRISRSLASEWSGAPCQGGGLRMATSR